MCPEDRVDGEPARELLDVDRRILQLVDERAERAAEAAADREPAADPAAVDGPTEAELENVKRCAAELGMDENLSLALYRVVSQVTRKRIQEREPE